MRICVSVCVCVCDDIVSTTMFLQACEAVIQFECGRRDAASLAAKHLTFYYISFDLSLYQL